MTDRIRGYDDYIKRLHEIQRQIDRDNEEESKMNLIFTKTRDVKNPVRAHATDAGIDFFVPNDCAAIRLKTNEDVLIDSGIKVIVPEGYALIFKEKSGVATKKKLTVGACVVDSDYRGNVHLHLFNNGLDECEILPGDKIVQGVVVPVLLCDLYEVSNEEYDVNETERADGGFGSSGDR